jgi:hypothetical protein
LEIDFTTMPALEVKYDGKVRSWYCYRTTYQLLAGTWNMTIKFKE